jgi:hypothetical protein
METSISQAMGSLAEFRPTGSSKSVQINVNSENIQNFTSTAATRDVYFTLPSMSNAFIDSSQTRLTFNLKSTETGAKFANGSVQSIIKSLQVLCGSVSVEQLDQANVWSALVADHSGGARSKTVKSIMEGASETAVKEGRDLLTSTERYSMPLMSSFLGSLSESYVPAISGTRLRCQFETGVNALVHATGAEYEISELSLQLTYLVVEPPVYNALLKEAGGKFRLHSTGVGAYSTNINLENSKSSILVPARYSPSSQSIPSSDPRMLSTVPRLTRVERESTLGCYNILGKSMDNRRRQSRSWLGRRLKCMLAKPSLNWRGRSPPVIFPSSKLSIPVLITPLSQRVKHRLLRMLLTSRKHRVLRNSSQGSIVIQRTYTLIYRPELE